MARSPCISLPEPFGRSAKSSKDRTIAPSANLSRAAIASDWASFAVRPPPPDGSSVVWFLTDEGARPFCSLRLVSGPPWRHLLVAADRFVTLQTRGSWVCQISDHLDILNTSDFWIRQDFCHNFLNTDKIHIRRQYKKNMNKKTDDIKKISYFWTSMFDRMNFHGVSPIKIKERLVVQVLNAAHARPWPARILRKSIWDKGLRIWHPSWYLGKPFVLIVVLKFVGLPLTVARDVRHKCLLSTIGPVFAYHCSELFEHVPASLVPTLSIVRRLASEVSSCSWMPASHAC